MFNFICFYRFFFRKNHSMLSFCFLKQVKTTSTYPLKIILDLTLFLKTVSRKQQSNSVKTILKVFSVFKSKKLFLNHTTKQLLSL